MVEKLLWATQCLEAPPSRPRFRLTPDTPLIPFLTDGKSISQQQPLSPCPLSESQLTEPMNSRALELLSPCILVLDDEKQIHSSLRLRLGSYYQLVCLSNPNE